MPAVRQLEGASVVQHITRTGGVRGDGVGAEARMSRCAGAVNTRMAWHSRRVSRTGRHRTRTPTALMFSIVSRAGYGNPVLIAA